jgi:hypothetical protein
MCISGGKRLIWWLHQKQKVICDSNRILKTVGNELDTWPIERFNSKYIFKFLIEKKLASDSSTVQYIIMKYKNKLTECYIPILDEEQENKMVQMFDEILKRSKVNLCVHYMFILVKCLELIGEYDSAQKCKDLYKNKRWDIYEQRWITFVSSTFTS